MNDKTGAKCNISIYFWRIFEETFYRAKENSLCASLTIKKNKTGKLNSCKRLLWWSRAGARNSHTYKALSSSLIPPLSGIIRRKLGERIRRLRTNQIRGGSWRNVKGSWTDYGTAWLLKKEICQDYCSRGFDLNTELYTFLRHVMLSRNTFLRPTVQIFTNILALDWNHIYKVRMSTKREMSDIMFHICM